MHDVTHVLIVLFVAYVGAQLGAEVAQRLRMPAVVGEICAGMALGPSGLGWVASGESLDTLAELGAVLLLFSVGLETRASDLRRVGRVATYVGVAGVALPFALGVGWAISARFGTAAAMFVGGGVCGDLGWDHRSRAGGTRHCGPSGGTGDPGRGGDRRHPGHAAAWRGDGTTARRRSERNRTSACSARWFC